MFGVPYPGQIGKPNSTNYPAYVSQVAISDGTTNDTIIKHSRVALTAVQVKALNTTPIAVVAAPGAGKYISVIEVFGYLNFNTTQYTGANAVEVRYTDGSGAKVTGDLASAWLDLGSSSAAKAIAAAVTPVANAAVVVAVPTANPAAGNSVVTIEVFYRVVTLP